LFIAKQIEILSFKNFKFSGKNSKKINAYKISKNLKIIFIILKLTEWRRFGILEIFYFF
jgi:hypothetical protein